MDDLIKELDYFIAKEGNCTIRANGSNSIHCGWFAWVRAFFESKEETQLKAVEALWNKKIEVQFGEDATNEKIDKVLKKLEDIEWKFIQGCTDNKIKQLYFINNFNKLDKVSGPQKNKLIIECLNCSSNNKKELIKRYDGDITCIARNSLLCLEFNDFRSDQKSKLVMKEDDPVQLLSWFEAENEAVLKLAIAKKIIKKSDDCQVLEKVYNKIEDVSVKNQIIAKIKDSTTLCRMYDAENNFELKYELLKSLNFKKDTYRYKEDNNEFIEYLKNKDDIDVLIFVFRSTKVDHKALINKIEELKRNGRAKDALNLLNNVGRSYNKKWVAAQRSILEDFYISKCPQALKCNSLYLDREDLRNIDKTDPLYRELADAQKAWFLVLLDNLNKGLYNRSMRVCSKVADWGDKFMQASAVALPFGTALSMYSGSTLIPILESAGKAAIAFGAYTGISYQKELAQYAWKHSGFTEDQVKDDLNDMCNFKGRPELICGKYREQGSSADVVGAIGDWISIEQQKYSAALTIMLVYWYFREVNKVRMEDLNEEVYLQQVLDRIQKQV